MNKEPKDKEPKDKELSRRERQIMDALYRLGKATAIAIRDALAHPPSYTAIRTHLATLQEKGLIKYEDDGIRHIYEPVVPREEMAKSVMEGVLQTFFENSVELVVTTLIGREEAPISREQLDRLAQIIDQARKEGR